MGSCFQVVQGLDQGALQDGVGWGGEGSRGVGGRGWAWG